MTSMVCRFRSLSQLRHVFDRLQRRYHYISYCLHSLSDNVYQEPWTDTFLETFMVPCGKFSEKWIAHASVPLIVLVYTLVLGGAYTFLVGLRELLDSWKIYFGYYILIQILFNYYCAWSTEPGYTNRIEPNQVTKYCRKCEYQKPERAHHCSICKQCVLMMDHHCPWINNCVGHRNHRYFFLFCFWTTFGAVYVVLFTFDIMFYLTIPGTRFARFCNYFYTSGIYELSINTQRYLTGLFYLCTTVTLALGGLTTFHIFLISTGQTSIERVQRRTLQATQENYNMGFITNWNIFFNIWTVKEFFIRFILPSRHLPYGDGIQWRKNPSVIEI